MEPMGLGFRLQGLGLGCRVSGVGFRVYQGFRVLGFRVQRSSA